MANLIQRSDIYKIGQIEEREKAEQVMIQVLKDAREVTTIQNRINGVIERITKWQRKWRAYLKRKEGFLELFRRLWIRNSASLYEKIVIPKLRKTYAAHKEYFFGENLKLINNRKLSYLRTIDIKNNE